MSLSAVQPRSPGRPRALTRDQVVDAALRLTEDGGFESVSMRNLGASLGVRPATVYAYFPGKEALKAAMMDRVLSAVVLVLEESEPDWRKQLANAMKAYYGVLLAHPGLLNPAIGLSASVPQGEVIADRWLQLLESGGYTRPQAIDRLAALTSFVFGSAASRVWSESVMRDAEILRPSTEAKQSSIRTTLQSLDLSVLDRAFDYGLELLLPGPAT